MTMRNVSALEQASDAPTTTCFTLDLPTRRRIERIIPGRYKNLSTFIRNVSTFIREGIDQLQEREDCPPPRPLVAPGVRSAERRCHHLDR